MATRKIRPEKNVGLTYISARKSTKKCNKGIKEWWWHMN